MVTLSTLSSYQCNVLCAVKEFFFVLLNNCNMWHEMKLPPPPQNKIKKQNYNFLNCNRKTELIIACIIKRSKFKFFSVLM